MEILIFALVAFVVLKKVSPSALINSATTALDSLTAPAYPQWVLDFATAIATAEGYYTSGTVANRANNPGDIVEGDIGNGVTGPENETIYATAQDGWNRLYKLIADAASNSSSLYMATMALWQFGATYTGTDGTTWTNNVVTALQNMGYSVDANSTLVDLAGG